MSWSSVIRHSKRDGVFEITICREAQRNALNSDVIQGIVEGWKIAERDDAIKVIVLTGEGQKAFCAGADLGASGDAPDFSRPRLAYADMLRLVQNSEKASIARVNGACLAGGIGLVGMTDLAIASEDAVFGLPEVKVGLFPMQVLALLQRIVPRRAISEWCLTGGRFSAQTALEAGLINRVVSHEFLDEEVDNLAQMIASGSPAAIRRGKYALRAMADMALEPSMAFAESQLTLVAQTDDAKEGIAAFMEKREPRWSGR